MTFYSTGAPLALRERSPRSLVGRVGTAVTIAFLMCVCLFSQGAFAANKVDSIGRALFSLAGLGIDTSRGDGDPSAPATFSVGISSTSYLAGSVTVQFAATGTGSSSSTTIVFSTAPSLDGSSVFNANGEYIFTRPVQTDTVALEAGTYNVLLTPTVAGAEAGLGGDCALQNGQTVTVSAAGVVSPAQLQLFCGTPTKILSASVLAEARAAAQSGSTTLPAVVEGAELFAVCLGNGGSNRIFGFENVPDDPDDLGGGVAFVEELFELPSLINSQGEGIELSCNGLSSNSLVGTAIDEPLWRYLVRLDLFSRINLDGAETDGTSLPGAGTYGDEEILSLLAPYEDLFAATSSPFEPLASTPTQRLRRLNFNFNTFGSMRWFDLSRISSNNAYIVGDMATSNNAETFYGYGVNIQVSAEALEVFNAFQSQPEIEIEVDSVSSRVSGGSELVRLPLDGDRFFVSEVITLGGGGIEDPLVFTAFGIPPGVTCSADISVDPLEDGARVFFDGFDYRLNGASPLSVACSADATFPVAINTTSYLAGSIEVDFNAVDASGSFLVETLNFSDPLLSGDDLFNEFGDYVFVPPVQNDVANLLPGQYTISVFENLTGAEPGLTGECDLVGPTSITVSADGTLSADSIEIVCGTPTKKLSQSVLDAAQEAGRRGDSVLPAVVSGPELFSVCLGNGGSNEIYDLDPTVFSPVLDAPRQLGSGVRFVEDVLSLPAMAASGGLGIDIHCSGMAADSASGSVIDEPLWAYLVRLDVLQRVYIAGLDFTSPGAGSYGSEEILSVLSPYESLFAATELPYGVLDATPTKRLRFLEFSYNSFSTPRWADMWRISSNNSYAVGDVRTTSDFGIVYSFGVQIDVTPEAQALLDAAPGQPLVSIEPDDEFGDPFEGINTVIEIPVQQNTALIFGPIDLGNLDEDFLLLTVTDLPSGVVCVASDVGALTNGVRVSINGYEYRPYGVNSALTINCDLSAETNRVRATFSFPDEVSGFPEFSGSVIARLVNLITGEIAIEQFATLVGDRRDYLFEVLMVPDGTYRLEAGVSDGGASRDFGCELDNGSFEVNQDDVELGRVSCSELTTSSSIGSGLLASCIRNNGISFLHQLEAGGEELDCGFAGGSLDEELLAKPSSYTTLNLSNTTLSASDIAALANADVNSQTFRKIDLSGANGITGLSNSDFLQLSRRFAQINTGNVEYPAGSGLVAQCMRVNGYAAFDDASLFTSGANLDCSGLAGFNDFADMGVYLREPIFEASEIDFSSSNLDRDYFSDLAEIYRFVFGRSVIRVGGNIGLDELGLVDYSRLARAFSVVDIGAAVFPNLTYIKAADPQAGAEFGSSIALSADGDLLVVGAPGWSSAEHSQVGKIYVFTRSGGVWSQLNTREPGGFAARDNARYGENVAVSADGLYIAVTVDNAGDSRTVDILGSTEFGYVLEDTISSAQSLGDVLKFHTEASGTYLFLGEPDASTSSGILAGRAYAYRRDSGSPFNLWQFFRLYEPTSAAASAGDQFGASIGLQGADTSSTFDDAVLIGAPGDDSLNTSTQITGFGTPLTNDDEPDSGAVWVYPSLSSSSSLFTYLKDEPGAVGFEPKEFGRNMSVSSFDQMILSRNEGMRFNNSLSSFTSEGSERDVGDVPRYDRSLENLKIASSVAVQTTRGIRQIELARPTSFGSPLIPLLSLSALQTPMRVDADFGVNIDLSNDGDRVVFAAPGDDSGQAGVNASENDTSATDSGAVYVSP